MDYQSMVFMSKSDTAEFINREYVKPVGVMVDYSIYALAASRAIGCHW